MKLSCNVRVNTGCDHVMSVVGGQCKVWRNVLVLWHLVLIDSWCNRQTDGQTGGWAGTVHGQHSVVWHQESGEFVGDFAAPPTPWKLQQAARIRWGPLGASSSARDLEDSSRRGKTLPCSSSERPLQVSTSRRAARAKRRRMKVAAMMRATLVGPKELH